jgi:hypothetical protein
VANDGDPWGKTTARLRGLSMHEESTNGGQSRWLADVECCGSLPQGGGKSSGKGEASTAGCFYSSRGEREGRGSPAYQRQDTDVEPDRRHQARARFLCSGTLMGGPRSRF